MIRLILNHEHLAGALMEAVNICRHRLFIATADVKHIHLPAAERGRSTVRTRSLLDLFHELAARNVEVRLLHGGVPSGPMIQALKIGLPATLTMRRCPRMHAKCVVADGRWMYLGSANLTGAGLGAKSARRRNFEAGIWTDQVELIDPVVDMLEDVWNASRCRDCDRTDFCPAPLEEPDLGG